MNFTWKNDGILLIFVPMIFMFFFVFGMSLWGNGESLIVFILICSLIFTFWLRNKKMKKKNKDK